MFESFGINKGYIEDLYTTYLQSPQAVAEHWRTFFQQASPSENLQGVSVPTEAQEAVLFDLRVWNLAQAYRRYGHLVAQLDPLGAVPPASAELALSSFGLSEADLGRVCSSVGVAGLPVQTTLGALVAHMEQTYCRAIGVEFAEVDPPEARRWLQERMEATGNQTPWTRTQRLHVLRKLTEAESLEDFIHKNYIGAKRFSLEGGESLIPMLDLLIESSGALGVKEIVLGMAHRGRLNVLVNILGKNVRTLFVGFDDKNPELFWGAGDVKYHLGYSSDRTTASGASVHLSLAFNPSHLEWVNPVVEGRARAKQDRRGGTRAEVMPVLIHGDASFIGQGIVTETLNLSNLTGYTTGGTVHLVVNNQIGFTTLPSDSRSTRYCSDVSRILRAPVFHVNGEDPEAVLQVTQLATEFRQAFGLDVVVDMYCFRRYGHNEGDEPRYTQPEMYSMIDRKKSIRTLYAEKLIQRGELTQEEADALPQEQKASLARALEESRQGGWFKLPSSLEGVWKGYTGGMDRAVPEVKTGVSAVELQRLLDTLTAFPSSFKPNPKLVALLEQRAVRARTGQPLDWGTGEQLAFATLLAAGKSIRITGQDAERATFSHRHAVLHDTETGAAYTPLCHLGPHQGAFEVHNSCLSEAAVLGFEYGYSLDTPDALVIWEAQFGDFCNTAQVLFDQFLSSAERKWARLSGLVLLLPHGYEGQGPEHSSARLERFLQLAGEDNMQICNLTTPVQLFHALRRQVLRPLRKPLVIFTPKSLLRHPQAVSALEEFEQGSFQHVLADSIVDASKVKKVLLCTGKVYYDLLKARAEKGREQDIALVRIEQLYPLPTELKEVLQTYKEKTPVVWVQEEPRNMGGWSFLRTRWEELGLSRSPLSVVSRQEAASPATGSKASHDLEQKKLLDEALALS